jgi:hypothetical protein
VDIDDKALYARPYLSADEATIAIKSEREIDVDELTGQELADSETWSALLVAYRKLKASKPEDRSEKARRYAVTITEMEKAMAYFFTMVTQDFEG